MTQRSLSRRRLLQLMGAGSAVVFSPGLRSSLAFGAVHHEADPLPPGSPVLVSLYLGGGVDGAHLVVPSGPLYGSYADLRRDLAVPEGDLLAIGPDAGLHPNLTNVKSLFDAGKAAVVRGVDLLNASGWDRLSHFEKTDHMMNGYPGTTPGGPPSGVWGRWADGLPDRPLALAAVDFGLPLLLFGQAKQQSAALPTSLGDALGAAPDPAQLPLIQAIKDLAGDYAATDRGLAATIARANAFAVELASELAPHYPPDGSDGTIEGDLRLIAELINANLSGTQVYATVLGGFDTHENQLYDLGDVLIPQLDAALGAFFAALNDDTHVIVHVWSEFGRRAEANVTGTDHGTANTQLLLGGGVRGGVYGAQPSFAPSALDDDGNLVGSVHMGSVYAELIDSFLHGSSNAVLGATYPKLGFVA